MNLPAVSTPTSPTQKAPVFPSLLAKPFSFLPQKLHNTAIIKSLNTILEEALQEGDLDFLDDQSVSVEISDLKLRFALSLDQEKLVAKHWQADDDLNLRGHLYDFLLLASRQEDSDTLFFQRR